MRCGTILQLECCGTIFELECMRQLCRGKIRSVRLERLFGMQPRILPNFKRGLELHYLHGGDKPRSFWVLDGHMRSVRCGEIFAGCRIFDVHGLRRGEVFGRCGRLDRRRVSELPKRVVGKRRLRLNVRKLRGGTVRGHDWGHCLL